jgi:hypothetical protein
MNSRERLIRTLNHKETDRIVLDLGSSPTTGIHVKIVEELRDYYGLERKPVRVIEPFQMLGEIDQELVDILGIDVLPLWGKYNLFGFDNNAPFKTFKTFWDQEVLVPADFNTRIGENGDLLMFPEGDTDIPPSAIMPKSGYFFDAIIRQEPLADKPLKIEDNLEEFGPISEAELIFLKDEINRLSSSGKGIVANVGAIDLGDIALVPGMNLKNPKGIRDVAEWYMSLITRPDYIKGMFEKQVEFGIENLKKIYGVLNDSIEVIQICGADFGTQESTFVSIEQFKDIWLPYYQKVNNWIHENTNWKTFKHSCGAVEGFMKYFIDAGFDIINPVQINARGMDPKTLKTKYGREIVFWGGGVDTQKILPFGTPAQVREQVLQTCDVFAKDGGFVFNTVHNIQANVPTKNVIAVIDAIKEFNGHE